MTEMFFEDTIDDSKYLGHLYGLGTTWGSEQPGSPLLLTSTISTVKEEDEDDEEIAMK